MATATAVAFWRSTTDGTSANGGGAIAPAAPGVIHESSGPLSLCDAGTLHATMDPFRWNGGRLWVVALYGSVAWGDDKCGALRREIIGEVAP